MSVRVRFAPSPTGFLHVGGARTALFCALFAKKHGGQFVLRIEDTDLDRSTEEALASQLEALQWLGINWDEGVDPDTTESFGPHAPYRQSQRLKLYQAKAEELLAQGKAYYCFMTDAEIEAQKASGGEGFQIQSPYRDWDLARAKAHLAEGAPAVIRFRHSGQPASYRFKDLIRGEVEFPTSVVGDFVLIRSNGHPVYNFCCVIDDALMEMSHVFRSEEHLNNTLRQLMLYDAFAWTPPQFAHFSMILGSDGKKLSKRHGATSLQEFRDQGYLPEALANYLSLLGWTHPDEKEVFSMAEAASVFNLDRITASPAVFDPAKLKWINSQHLRQLTDSKLWEAIRPRLHKAGMQLKETPEWIEQSLRLFRPYLETLEDAIELYRPLSITDFRLFPEASEVLHWSTTQAVLSGWKQGLESLSSDAVSEADFTELQERIKSECQVKGKHLFMPLRVAVIGKPQGAELKTLVPLLGKHELIRRVEVVQAESL